MPRSDNRVPFNGRGNISAAIIVDGETEKIYFRQMSKEERCRLKPVKKDGDVESQTCQVDSLLNQGYPAVYWLIDYDDIARDNRECQDINRKQLTKLKEAMVKYIGEHRVKILFNSPCLEYWLLLHYEPTNHRAYEMYEGELKTALRNHLADYDKSKKYYETGVGLYSRLRQMLPTAVQAASALRFDPTNGHCAPSAQIYRLLKDFGVV